MSWQEGIGMITYGVLQELLDVDGVPSTSQSSPITILIRYIIKSTYPMPDRASGVVRSCMLMTRVISGTYRCNNLVFHDAQKPE